TDGRKLMSKKAAEHHHKAAEHHEHAARHHKEAAKCYEAGRHETGAHHAQLATGHQRYARRHAAEAAKAHVVSCVDLVRNHKQTGLITDRVKEILDSENRDRPNSQALMETEPSNQGRKWTDFWRGLLQCVSEEEIKICRAEYDKQLERLSAPTEQSVKQN
ncbi:MAG: hypothetical protein WAK48_25490, partial [Candidatus Acidiferrum sp.]